METAATRAAAPAPSDQRVLELDGLRGLAVLAVIVWHYVGLTLRVPGPELMPLKYGLIILRSGVDLFFVLSGYLIGGILMDHRDSPNYFRTFYGRRVLRIFPVYYLTLLAFAVALAAGGKGRLFDGPLPWWSYLTLTQNYVMVYLGTYGAGWLTVTWSLAIEEQFYLGFPLLVRWVRGPALAWWLGAGALGAVGLRIVCVNVPALADFAPYMWLPCRADALLTGALLALALRHAGAAAWLRANRATVARVFFGFFLAAVVLAAVLHRGITWHMAWWGHTVLTLFYGTGLLLAVLHAGGAETAFLRRTWLVRLGAISYAAYLWHAIVLQAVFEPFSPRVQLRDPRDWLLMFAALALTLGLCALSYFVIERPAMRLGRRLKY